MPITPLRAPMPRMLFAVVSAAMVASLPVSAAAQNMTTAAEIKPILTVTKPNWIAVRPYEGRDWLYFTNLLAWRCGLSEIHYTVNGGDEMLFEAEPCYEDISTPNALKAETVDAIARTFDLSFVQEVTVRVVYDDGSEDTAQYMRKDVEIP